MGCVASKNGVDSSAARRGRRRRRALVREPEAKPRYVSASSQRNSAAAAAAARLLEKKHAAEEHGMPMYRSSRLGGHWNSLEAEQLAAGWPSWLTSVAGEAIGHWIPLNHDNFHSFRRVRTVLLSFI
jgi:cyclin-dependent kinase 12/13